ncbi:MAG: PorT family protein [Bacteroidales bacterium]|nr:PorT family protein [Bacteroidales bacterium]MCF8390234.1 PorT family protein [Bacteroidales bacterium]
MRKSFKLLFFLSLIFLNPGILFAQEKDCAVNLQEAQNQFNMGQIERVPDLLMDCLKSGFTREERIQAYKVLINAFIFDDNLLQAELYCLEFLKKYPEYEIVATDPSEFVNFLNEFDNDPRASVGLGGGVNFSRIRMFEPFGVDSQVGLGSGIGGDGDYNSSGFGFQVGFIYNLNIRPNLELSMEPMIIQNTFEFQHRPFDFAFVEYSEDQLRVDFPVSMIWVLKKYGKVAPYLRAGLKTSYLISAKSDAKRTYENTTSPLEDAEGPGLEILDNRKINNYWAILGGGVRYKIPNAYFFLDLRYNLGLLNQVNNLSRNDGMDENAWLYYYLDDNFVLNDISVCFGISKTIYNPKRK